jgi:hypothetical protein
MAMPRPTGTLKWIWSRSTPMAAPANIARTAPSRRLSNRGRCLLTSDSPAREVMVEVMTTVVMSRTPKCRAIRAWEPMCMAITAAIMTPMDCRPTSSTMREMAPVPVSAIQPAVRRSVTLRFQPFGLDWSVNPATAAPRRKAPSATSGPRVGRFAAPANAIARITTLPVMFPVKT